MLRSLLHICIEVTVLTSFFSHFSPKMYSFIFNSTKFLSCIVVFINYLNINWFIIQIIRARTAVCDIVKYIQQVCGPLLRHLVINIKILMTVILVLQLIEPSVRIYVGRGWCGGFPH